MLHNPELPSQLLLLPSPVLLIPHHKEPKSFHLSSQGNVIPGPGTSFVINFEQLQLNFAVWL